MQLREVLEQRLDGMGKTRRRRTNTGGIPASRDHSCM